jgi:hypothetical protein
MKVYLGVEVQLHAFLTSALDGGDWSASRPGRFAPTERAPGTHWIGGCVGPRAVLDAVQMNKCHFCGTQRYSSVFGNPTNGHYPESVQYTP